MNEEKITEILDHYQADQSAIIAILQDIQHQFGYLPKEALLQASRLLFLRPSVLFLEESTPSRSVWELPVMSEVPSLSWKSWKGNSKLSLVRQQRT